jgi:prepilin-type N-terminal cleavage/methylation domain-containing protein
MKSHTVSLGRGFTLIEVLIVIALLALAAGATLIIGTDSIGRATASRERDMVASLLHTARAEALANVDEKKHGVHVGSDSYVLFSGNSYSAGASDNREFPKEGAVTVSGPSDIIFDALSAKVGTGVGTLLFTDSAASASVSINAVGRIDW